MPLLSLSAQALIPPQSYFSSPPLPYISLKFACRIHQINIKHQKSQSYCVEDIKQDKVTPVQTNEIFGKNDTGGGKKKLIQNLPMSCKRLKICQN